VIFPLSRWRPDGPCARCWRANPITPVIEGFRGALLGTPMDWSTLWYSAICAVVLLVVGLILFQRAERSYADVV
ncbi:MAG: ABC transporter permease, partial [Flavobacteriales bacterium]|nr:ABC transporter permease [Flavobacteriales bacterium]